MTLAEGLLIIVALSLIIFQTAEYEGSNLHKLKARNLMCVCLIFLVGQTISMGLGYVLSQLPCFQPEISRDVKAMCYIMAAVIFFVLGAYLLYKTWKTGEVVERLRELRYSRIALEAVTAAIATLAAGFGCGLLRLDPLHAFIPVVLITILAVVIGIYTGYYQGQRFTRLVFGLSGAVFCGTGIVVLVRYF